LIVGAHRKRGGYCAAGSDEHDNVRSRLRGYVTMRLEQPIPILGFVMTYFVDIDPRIARLGLHAGRLQAGG
jgi:hypothetical protein